MSQRSWLVWILDIERCDFCWAILNVDLGLPCSILVFVSNPDNFVAAISLAVDLGVDYFLHLPLSVQGWLFLATSSGAAGSLESDVNLGFRRQEKRNLSPSEP